MRRVLVSVMFIILLLAACSPQAQPTELPQDVTDAATQVSDSLTPAQNAAIAALSKNVGLDPSEIKMVSVEPMEWPDACLGITQEGISCAQVITPGYKIVLEANGKQVEYRTDEAGTLVRPATVALTWQRMGGIAGFCDTLTIYLSGEVQGNTCKGAGVVEKSLSDLLSPAEIATMNEWISKYGEVNIDASDPVGAADAMSVNLTLYGTGSEQLNEPAQQLLIQFVQNLNQKLMSQ